MMQDDVTTLNFMKKSNHFIVMINQLQYGQLIKAINGFANKNQMNIMVIYGSCDKTIKFWTKQNQWLQKQTITNHTDIVYGLSLNQKQNILISCGLDAQILIIEQSQKDSKWIVIQTIQVEKSGQRICFINDDVFSFQPQKKCICSCQSGSDDCYFFPQEHIKSKFLLVNKNYKYVNLIRKNENGEFKTEQSIEFGNQSLYGCMSDDGQYLITWDYSSKEIQIRKYNEIQNNIKILIQQCKMMDSFFSAHNNNLQDMLQY
ncbi:unnamed protein product [Paramecium sonneborni]|uniref:Uncharacterized protein n=1 Tax=Paramecium sonneborni TaxID=65129 RepID=A0A8S1PTE6_9CILI|nr:unnamed protein product [Paramecium sonneborni]